MIWNHLWLGNFYPVIEWYTGRTCSTGNTGRFGIPTYMYCYDVLVYFHHACSRRNYSRTSVFLQRTRSFCLWVLGVKTSYRKKESLTWMQEFPSKDTGRLTLSFLPLDSMSTKTYWSTEMDFHLVDVEVSLLGGTIDSGHLVVSSFTFMNWLP